MGFFSELTGKAAAKRAQKASKQAQAQLDASYAEARPLLSAGYDVAGTTLDAGYGRAGDWLSDYYDVARDDIAGGYDAVPGILEDYYGRADDRLVEGRDTARELLDPWIASGRSAQDTYDQYLNPETQGDFFANYHESPYQQFGYDMDLKRQNAISNAGGNLYGAKGQLAASRVTQERAENNLQTYLGQLERQGTRGGQYASEAAGLEERTGDKRAGLQTGLGDRLSDVSINRGTALGNLATGYGTNRANLETGLANAQSNLAIGRGNDEANLVYGYGQQKAGNIIGATNAVNQAKASGVQNILGGAGLLASAFIPGASGISAAGGMLSGAQRLIGGGKTTINPDVGMNNWGPIVKYA